jgi:DNA replication licensing factor MCM2
MCTNCGVAGQGSLKINLAKSEYGNYQKITLQESPGSVPAGRVPRYKDVVLLGDLIDIVRPGEEVEITGIFMHSYQRVSSDKTGFPVFSTQIEANCVQKKNTTANSVFLLLICFNTYWVLYIQLKPSIFRF